MSRVNFSVKSTADRWWVAIEDGNIEFEKPRTSESFDLDPGTSYAAIYYAQGSPGKSFTLIGKNEEGVEILKIEREIGANGFAYGHKGFRP